MRSGWSLVRPERPREGFEGSVAGLRTPQRDPPPQSRLNTTAGGEWRTVVRCHYRWWWQSTRRPPGAAICGQDVIRPGAYYRWSMRRVGTLTTLKNDAANLHRPYPVRTDLPDGSRSASHEIWPRSWETGRRANTHLLVALRYPWPPPRTSRAGRRLAGGQQGLNATNPLGGHPGGSSSQLTLSRRETCACPG